MSDIDMTFEELPSLSVLAASLERAGGEVLRGDPLTYMDNYDWQHGNPANRAEILAGLSRSLDSGTAVGFYVCWPVAERAGSLAVFPEHKLISLSPHTGGSQEVSRFGIPMLGWYWDVLLASLGSLSLVSMAAQSSR